MRIVNTKNLKDGMKLGKAVYSTEGSILLRKNIILTSGYIQKLKEKNIPSVYIEDEISDSIEVSNAIDPEIKMKAVTTIKDLFSEMSPKKQKYNTDKKTFISNKMYNSVRNSISMIMQNIKENNDSLMNMVEVLSTDLSAYVHCVNVAVLAIMTGRSMGLDEYKVKELGIGALMHDIGRVYIPSEIINKPSSLTKEEYEIVKKHPAHGYQMVKNNKHISAYVKTIILMHHERLDGSGYPLKLKANKINKYARIVSICDAFEAMVSDRAYRKKMPIYKALELLSAETTKKLDGVVFNHFLKCISIYPKGTGVVLNTGEKGIVIENNIHMPARPKVRIILQPDGSFYPGFKVLDLEKKLTLFIEDTCEIIY